MGKRKLSSITKLGVKRARTNRKWIMLRSGTILPWVCFGTYKLKKEDVIEPVKAALKFGYRGIDTASVYKNETQIAMAIKESIACSGKLFLQTKLWRSHHGKEAWKNAIRSLKKLGIGKVTSLLIHWPGPGYHMFKKYEVPRGFTPETRLETWRTLMKLKKEGKVASIGVSNYGIAHIEQIIEANLELPDINQVEFHPLCYQKELLEFCRKHGITLQAYAPLGGGDKGAELLENPTVKDIAEEHSRTTAQVLIRWAIQHGVPVVTKSCTPERIQSNINVFNFELTKESMERLDGLEKEIGGKRFCWKGVDPSEIYVVDVAEST